MSDCCKDRTELLAAHAQDRPHAAGHAEHSSKNTCVDGDGIEFAASTFDCLPELVYALVSCEVGVDGGYLDAERLEILFGLI